MIKYAVTIASQNGEGKVVENVIETDGLVGAMRIIRTFKAKRGYAPFSWRVDEVEVLV